MKYERKKRKNVKYRKISGYTREDGTEVSPYKRKKRTDIRDYRTVRSKK